MFRLFNHTDKDISVARKHKYGDEAPSDIVVPPGNPFEGGETVYAYSVSDEFLDCVLEDRKEDMGSRIEAYSKRKQAEADELARSLNSGVVPPNVELYSPEDFSVNALLAGTAAMPTGEPDTLTVNDIQRIRASLDAIPQPEVIDVPALPLTEGDGFTSTPVDDGVGGYSPE